MINAQTPSHKPMLMQYQGQPRNSHADPCSDSSCRSASVPCGARLQELATSRFPIPRSPLSIPGRASGFTLIEILVVVVILGILAAIVVPRVMERPAEARITRVRQDVQGVMTALNLYKLDNFRYPSSEQGMQALVAKPSGQPDAPNWKGPYLDRLPKDPWNQPYQYQQPGQHGDVDIYSHGSDGRPGGEGDAADIGNWSE